MSDNGSSDRRRDDDSDSSSDSPVDPRESGSDEPLGSLVEDIEERAGADTISGETDSTVRDPDAPLGEVAATVDDRRSREDTFQGLFAEEDVPEIDAEVVWQQLEAGGPAEPVPPDDHEERVVAKDEYCESCEHFSTPPEMHCTHDGTEILELVDVEHVRVVDCPVVRENEELERL